MKMTRREAMMTGALGTLGLMAMSGAELSQAATKRPTKPGRNGKVTLLQINDSHGYLDVHLEWFAAPGRPVYRMAGGYARIATLARRIREETKNRVLFLDNGDTSHGTYPVVQSRGEALLPIMNELGLNAMTVHWDFAYGPAQLQSLRRGLKYPMLAINVDEKESGKQFLPPYAVQEAGGLRMGIIGIASNIVDKTPTRNGALPQPAQTDPRRIGK